MAEKAKFWSSPWTITIVGGVASYFVISGIGSSRHTGQLGSSPSRHPPVCIENSLPAYSPFGFDPRTDPHDHRYICPSTIRTV